MLRSPRNFRVPLANNERDDLQWVAVIDGYDTTCNKYILKFLSTTGLEKKCIRQPNYDLKDIRVSSNNKEGAVPIYGGEGVVANIIGGTLYDVRLTNQHNVVMDGLTKNQISKCTPVRKTINEQKGNQEVVEATEETTEVAIEEAMEEVMEEKATINTSLDKDVIHVGDLVHVLLPIGTQVMAVPRFYVKGILMKINQSSNKTTNLQTINVKINKQMCRNLPLSWLHLEETAAVLPELGSTVFVCYHPPNDIPNITVPWLISKWRTDELQKLKKLKEEANALKDVKDEGHIQTSSSSRSSSTESQHPKLNLLYLSSTTNKKLKNEFMFYHDDDKDHENIIIRNNGLKKISIRITTSVGYQWSRNVDNTERNKEKKERKENNMENNTENNMETEKEIKDRNQTIVLMKGNFITIKVSWLRKNEKIVSDIGWLCCTNMNNLLDASMLTLKGTCNNPLLQSETTTQNNLNKATISLDLPKVILTTHGTNRNNKNQSTNYILIRNTTCKELEVEAMFHDSNGAPFSIVSQTDRNVTGNRTMSQIGPYGYICIEIIFTPKTRGTFTKSLTILGGYKAKRACNRVYGKHCS